ncbi:MAG: VWA domain-containing protein [Chitinophagales bacterium]
MKNIISIIIVSFLIQNSYGQSLKKLGLIFDSRTYSFGDVEQWNNQPAIFTFTNRSKMSLTILPLFTENDLDVVIPDRPIEPGETIIIKAMYYTDGKGLFSRSFPIYFGSRAEPVNLKITGNIKSLSPEAYIQCPMAKPELSKPRIELVGDVAEIDTEFPISGATIEIIGLQNRKEVALFSNSRGKFGAKLPVGNYMVKVSHPNYVTYNGTIYIGQTSPPLRIRLNPINEEPIFVQNTEPIYEQRKEDYEAIDKKNEVLKNKETKNELSDKAKNVNIPKEENIKKHKENIDTKEADIPNRENKLERDIDYIKNEPKDNPFSSKDNSEDNEIPQTLTTYKESEKNKPIDKEPKKNEQTTDKPYIYDDKEKKPEDNNTDKLNPNELYTNNKDNNDNPNKKDVENTPYKEQKSKTPDKERYNKEKTPKEKKEREEKAIPVIIPKNNYAFRVLDKNSLDAIEDASIFLSDLYDKRNKHNERTDVRGIAELEITPSDYRFLATADGYISNEIKILKDDKSEVFKILLTPVSSLYEEIYEAKKERQKENEELLSKLSFGKTDFSFAKDEPEKIENNTPELTAYKAPEKNRNTEKETIIAEDNSYLPSKNNDPIIVEKIIVDKAKEDSLQNIIEQLEALNKRNAKLEDDKNAELRAVEKKREQEKVDSLNNYISDLLAKNNAIQNDLNKVEEDKQALKTENERDKAKLEELKRKETELLEKDDEDPFSTKKYQANNIMFLIDVSTSMAKNNKMEMLKTSIKNLTAILRDIDRVAIITYNQKTNIVLESVSGNNKSEIITALDSLKTGGLTNGVKGITTAYDMLEYYYIPEGNNQIILATDGLFSEFNNELTENELNKLVKKQAEKNMKLTVVGFGKQEEGKNLMGKLAKNGNGQYIQISNDYMTRDVLIREIKLNSEIKN